jgi:hypothetical protein
MKRYDGFGGGAFVAPAPWPLVLEERADSPALEDVVIAVHILVHAC